VWDVYTIVSARGRRVVVSAAVSAHGFGGGENEKQKEKEHVCQDDGGGCGHVVVPKEGSLLQQLAVDVGTSFSLALCLSLLARLRRQRRSLNSSLVAPIRSID
jgi:hypothetical protein